MVAATLQFSMKDKRITSTICEVTSIQGIEKTLLGLTQIYQRNFGTKF